LVLLLVIGCGHDYDGQNLVDLNKPSTSTVGPKTQVELEACQAFVGAEYCNCLDKVAAKSCSRFIPYADNHSYNDCIQPFLDDAYHGYCTINKTWAVNVQRQGGV